MKYLGYVRCEIMLRVWWYKVEEDSVLSLIMIWLSCVYLTKDYLWWKKVLFQYLMSYDYDYKMGYYLWPKLTLMINIDVKAFQKGTLA